MNFTHFRFTFGGPELAIHPVDCRKRELSFSFARRNEREPLFKSQFNNSIRVWQARHKALRGDSRVGGTRSRLEAI